MRKGCPANIFLTEELGHELANQIPNNGVRRNVCHQPYGDYAAHSYTAETKKVEALKTAGNCRDKAVYYYSCAVCGNFDEMP